MKVRWYQPEDDEYLMELERLCPRGEPRPFVHFRRHFRDRADLFDQPHLFIAEKDGRPVGVTSIAIKHTHIDGDEVRLAYSFDTRVHPGYRRQGIANAMQEAKLHFLKANGVHGIYAYVVSTNYPSINMLEKVGFYRHRLILYMTFPPYPMIMPPPSMPQLIEDMSYQDYITTAHESRDLYIPEVARKVSDYNFFQVCADAGGRHFASLNVFDQSMVYQQVSADDPWPTEDQLRSRARTLRIFDEVGINHPDYLRGVFDYIRDMAVTDNVSKLTWIIDRSLPVPAFVFEEASHQKDYWMMIRPLVQDWEPDWQSQPMYIDARDL